MLEKKELSRRELFKNCALFCAGMSLPAVDGFFPEAGLVNVRDDNIIEARYYEKLDHKKIKCVLCPRECLIDDQERGYCGVRENRNGTYYTLVYSNPCSAHIDPIEKKPLFHFLPGSLAFSIATVGCNIMCKFCQNWQISQVRPEQIKTYTMTPETIARIARERNSASIAYTYTEPVIFAEYMYDCAVEGRKKNVKSVMISNGYIKKEPMKDLCKVLDAVKIDLKAYTEKFYKDLCAGELKPVLDTLVLLKTEGMWTEIVYLIIPTLNDKEKELKDMCKWIYRELGPDVPIHFSRFYPQYMIKNLPPTPLKTLETARNIALEEGLNYAYIGNISPHEGENTYCHKCGKPVIKRMGYTIVDSQIKNGQCSFCKSKIPGVWK